MLNRNKNVLSLFDDHTRLLTLALPMIFANITTPLLGLVDTAVLGHMSTSAMLAGASVGALILTQIYWVCGFLRMSSTGLSAQAKGTVDTVYDSAKVLWQTMSIALIIGLVIFSLQGPILSLGIYFSDPSSEVNAHLKSYFLVRVWGAPAALLNLSLIGWLVGQQKTRTVMMIQITGNLMNAMLDIAFVFGMGFSVSGVALASVLAEYSMMLMGLYVALKHIRGQMPQPVWFNRAARKVLMKLNGDMLLRNLALQGCLAFLTFQGARYGETSAAINAILMQFFVLIALGLDGIAYGVEALVGEAKGADNEKGIKARTYQGLWWSSVFALGYSAVFFLFGKDIISLLTEHQHIVNAAQTYLPLMVLLPLLAHWCFLFDGVFVGLMRASAMRNTMLFSAIMVFFPVWYATEHQENVSLWYALLAFLLARGVSLGVSFFRLGKRHELCCDKERQNT
ncbi:MATE family efflux transporter [Alteromonas sp. V450]|uniref:MATE family efflux transporter n=1 Tax=Alteromonas sp. V450 TaxID=1912139 RepID=UPI0008FF2D9A|nr:MATE family efflux transporter [Alteromonas sp. V450]OJF69836.1 MATE family efflux transporter [Alteromonas sp. V450]